LQTGDQTIDEPDDSAKEHAPLFERANADGVGEMDAGGEGSGSCRHGRRRLPIARQS